MALRYADYSDPDEKALAAAAYLANEPSLPHPAASLQAAASLKAIHSLSERPCASAATSPRSNVTEGGGIAEGNLFSPSPASERTLVMAAGRRDVRAGNVTEGGGIYEGARNRDARDHGLRHDRQPDLGR